VFACGEEVGDPRDDHFGDVIGVKLSFQYLMDNRDYIGFSGTKLIVEAQHI